MKKAFAYLLFSYRILMLLYCAFWAIGVMSFAIAFNKTVAQEETISNFTAHETEIIHFSDLLLSKRSAKHEILFSLHGNEGTLSIGRPSWTVDQSSVNDHFDFKVSLVNEETLFLKELDWDIETFRNIIATFRKTNCKSARTNEEGILIKFKTGTWSSYGYQVNSMPINASMRKKYEKNGMQCLNKRVTLRIATAL